MDTIDHRARIFELDEIYKYKDLINTLDKSVIKQIILKNDKQSEILYEKFMQLVADEVDHQINKAEFQDLKDALIVKMSNYLMA